MGRYVIIFLGLLTFVSCNHFQQKELFIKEPALLPLDNYKKEIFDEPFFIETHFNYSNNFKNQTHTTKFYYSSETIIINDTTKFFLRNCKATKNNDSLLLQLNDMPFSESLYELTILKQKNQINTNYYQTFSITDSSYKQPTYQTIDQNLILDKAEYIKGDTLKGKIVLKIVSHHTWHTDYKDTINIYGLIKTKVE